MYVDETPAQPKGRDRHDVFRERGAGPADEEGPAGDREVADG